MIDEDLPQYKEGEKSDHTQEKGLDEIEEDPQYEKMAPLEEEMQIIFQKLHEQDEKLIYEALCDLYDVTKDFQYDYPADFLEKLLELLSIQNEKLHNELIYVLINAIKHENDTALYLKENGLFDYIEDQFPSLYATKLLLYLFKKFDEIKFHIMGTELKNKLIESLSQTDDDIHFSYLADICAQLVAKKITKEVTIDTDEIIEIFDHLLEAFLRIPREDENAVISFANAFSFYIDSNKLFLDIFLRKDLIDLFIHYPCDNPKYVENVLLMASSIARNSEECAKYLEARHAMEFCEHYLDSDNKFVLADAFHVLTELLIYIPELCNHYVSSQIIHKAVSIFRDDSTSILVQKAILRLSVYIINYMPSAGFHLVEESGLYNILFENCPLTDPKDSFFVIYAILRLFQEGYDIKYSEHGHTCDHCHDNDHECEEDKNEEEKNEINVDLIEWLEDQRGKGSEKTELIIEELIKTLKHEQPI